MQIFRNVLKHCLNELNKKKASTDGLSSICSLVQLRPHFYIFDGPSFESIRDVDGLSSWIVRCPHPSMLHGPCGGRSIFKNSSARPVDVVHLKIIVLLQRSNSSMRTVWAQILVHCPHGRMDVRTVEVRCERLIIQIEMIDRQDTINSGAIFPKSTKIIT